MSRSYLDGFTFRTRLPRLELSEDETSETNDVDFALRLLSEKEKKGKAAVKDDEDDDLQVESGEDDDDDLPEDESVYP